MSSDKKNPEHKVYLSATAQALYDGKKHLAALDPYIKKYNEALGSLLKAEKDFDEILKKAKVATTKMENAFEQHQNKRSQQNFVKIYPQFALSKDTDLKTAEARRDVLYQKNAEIREKHDAHKSKLVALIKTNLKNDDYPLFENINKKNKALMQEVRSNPTDENIDKLISAILLDIPDPRIPKTGDKEGNLEHSIARGEAVEALMAAQNTTDPTEKQVLLEKVKNYLKIYGEADKQHQDSDVLLYYVLLGHDLEYAANAIKMSEAIVSAKQQQEMAKVAQKNCRIYLTEVDDADLAIESARAGLEKQTNAVIEKFEAQEWKRLSSHTADFKAVLAQLPQPGGKPSSESRSKPKPKPRTYSFTAELPDSFYSKTDPTPVVGNSVEPQSIHSSQPPSALSVPTNPGDRKMSADKEVESTPKFAPVTPASLTSALLSFLGDVTPNPPSPQSFVPSAQPTPYSLQGSESPMSPGVGSFSPSPSSAGTRPPAYNPFVDQEPEIPKSGGFTLSQPKSGGFTLSPPITYPQLEGGGPAAYPAPSAPPPSSSVTSPEIPGATPTPLPFQQGQFSPAPSVTPASGTTGTPKSTTSASTGNPGSSSSASYSSISKKMMSPEIASGRPRTKKEEDIQLAIALGQSIASLEKKLEKDVKSGVITAHEKAKQVSNAWKESIDTSKAQMHQYNQVDTERFIKAGWNNPSSSKKFGSVSSATPASGGSPAPSAPAPNTGNPTPASSHAIGGQSWYTGPSPHGLTNHPTYQQSMRELTEHPSYKNLPPATQALVKTECAKRFTRIIHQHVNVKSQGQTGAVQQQLLANALIGCRTAFNREIEKAMHQVLKDNAANQSSTYSPKI